MSRAKSKFAVVGCGKVGTALAVNLIGAGYTLTGFSCTTPDSLKRAETVTSCANNSLKFWEVTRAADLVFITTPDTAIEGVCSKIASQNGFKEDSVVLHCSGALSSSILSAAKHTVHTGSLHPLQSFASTGATGNPFHGIVMSSEGDAVALDACRSIAGDLGAKFIKILTDSKLLYHAAAVTASNYLVTLMGLSLGLMEKAGVAEKDAVATLQPLMEGTLSNIKTSGVTAALTGPVARGDMDIVRQHIQAMEAGAIDLVGLYKGLGGHTVKIAERQGLDKSIADDFLRLFNS